MKALWLLATLFGLLLSIAVFSFPFTELGSSVSASFTLVLWFLGMSLLVATGIMVYYVVIPKIFRREFPYGYAIVLENLGGKSKVVTQSEWINPTWFERGRISLRPIKIRVDTFKEGSKFHGADDQPVNAAATVWLKIPAGDNEIKEALKTFPDHDDEDGRTTFFQDIFTALLSEAAKKHLLIENWETTRTEAIEYCQESFSEKVKHYGHEIETQGDIIFKQRRIGENEPTSEEAQLTKKNVIQTNKHRKEQEESTARTDQEIATIQENKEQKIIDAQIETKNKQHEQEMQGIENKNTIVLTEEDNKASLAQHAVQNQAAEVEEKRNLTQKTTELEKANQALQEMKSEFERDQKRRNCEATREMEKINSEAEFVKNSVEHRLLEESIKCRQKILQQNTEFPEGDVEVQIRKEELKVQKELIDAQMKILAAAYNNTTTTVVADAESAERLSRSQIEAMAIGAKVSGIARSVLDEPTIMGAARYVVNSLFPNRGREGEAAKDNTGRTDVQKDQQNDDIDL